MRTHGGGAEIVTSRHVTILALLLLVYYTDLRAWPLISPAVIDTCTSVPIRVSVSWQVPTVNIRVQTASDVGS
jgi:hypothetical protein